MSATEAGKKTSRKERRKQELSAKMDETLVKLEKAAVAAESGEGERHALRHTEGNFWKDRKDEKKRTLFFGGIPAQFKRDDIAALVDSVEDADGTLEKVDFIGSSVPEFKQRTAKPRNAFVRFSTVDAAMAVQQRLDGFTVEGSSLRVNFSADKQQRAVAIAKRDGGRGGGRGGGFGGDKHQYARAAGGNSRGRGGRGFGGGRGRGGSSRGRGFGRGQG
jgi:RNA recognition motif-containing protein